MINKEILAETNTSAGLLRRQHKKDKHKKYKLSEDHGENATV